jgi:hypothetical protein
MKSFLEIFNIKKLFVNKTRNGHLLDMGFELGVALL